ncbi:alpha/beta hydrolase-fold protein [Actinokineospora soli]
MGDTREPEPARPDLADTGIIAAVAGTPPVETRPPGAEAPIPGTARAGVSRRAVLLAGAATAVGGIAGVVTGTVPIARTFGVAGQRVPQPVVRGERVWSRARGREVALVTVLPTELPIKDMPVCLFLHGLRGSAASAVPGPLPDLLVRQVAHEQVKPFALVSVDGGDNYWHENHPGDDPMGMLIDELPHWLKARHLGRVFAAAGVSMGGFGALLYDRRRAERGQPVEAAAAISPGLMTWAEMRKRNAFADEREWAGLDPRNNVAALGGTPVAVWCGAQDPFAAGTREFIAKANPRIGYIGPGAHDGRFFDRMVPDVLAFLAAAV